MIKLKLPIRTLNIAQYCIYAILFVLCAIFTYFTLILYVPFFVYRKCLILFVSKFKTLEFGDILDPAATYFADNGHTSHSVIVSLIKVKGIISRKRVQELIHKNVINAKTDSSPSQPRYPNMTRYPFYFMGYWFWIRDQYFIPENHIKQTSNLSVLENADYKIHQYFLNKPFSKHRSPWDITLFTSKDKSYNSTMTIAIRFHHCLGDPNSIVNLIVEALGQQAIKPSIERPPVKRISFVRHILMFPFVLVQNNLELLLHKQQVFSHPWRVHNFKADMSSLVVRHSNKVPLERIRVAAKKNGKVYMSAYLMAAIAGGVRHFMRKNNFHADKEPFPMICTIPKSSYDKELKNQFKVSVFPLPTNHVWYPARLFKCNHVYSNLIENSIDPLCMKIMMHVLMTFVGPLRLRIPISEIFAASMSNLSRVSYNEFMVGENACLDFSLSVGCPLSSLGVSFSTFSHKKNIQFCVVAKASILNEQKCQELVTMVENEFFLLTQQKISAAGLGIRNGNGKVKRSSQIPRSDIIHVITGRNVLMSRQKSMEVEPKVFSKFVEKEGK